AAHADSDLAPRRRNPGTLSPSRNWGRWNFNRFSVADLSRHFPTDSRIALVRNRVGKFRRRLCDFPLGFVGRHARVASGKRLALVVDRVGLARGRVDRHWRGASYTPGPAFAGRNQ